jgi:hypothetical protein
MPDVSKAAGRNVYQPLPLYARWRTGDSPRGALERSACYGCASARPLGAF